MTVVFPAMIIPSSELVKPQISCVSGPALVLATTLDRFLGEQFLEISNDDRPDRVLDALRAQVPRLRAALAGDEPADVAQELRGIVEELYDVTERYWPVLAVIERCAVELPELDALWFGGTRHGYHAGLAKYLERRTSSRLLRPMPDATLAARVVTESVAWFGWHRREERDSALYDDQTARRTVIEFVCAALIPDSAPKEHRSWTEPSGTIRPATFGYPTPTATGRSAS